MKIGQIVKWRWCLRSCALLCLLGLAFVIAVPGFVFAQAEPSAITAESTPASGEETIIAARVLTLWVPPQFDPLTNDEAAKLVNQLIADFTVAHPEISVKIRTKAISGPSSAINSLLATVNAAPEIIPSLIIMSRNDMISAMQKGLIYPISTEIFTDADTWFPYARNSSSVDNLIYGIPIAGDSLMLTYRPTKTGPEMETWEKILSRGMPIGFNPADPEDLFGTFMYLNYGGKMVNEQGQPWLDQTILSKTLAFFLNGGQQGTFPPSLAQENSMTQNWQLFLDGTMNIIFSPFSKYRHNAKPEFQCIPLPLLQEGSNYPLVNTWNIVLSAINPEMQSLAVKLAERFAAPAFNDQWTQVGGYLPVRVSSFAYWKNDPLYEEMVALGKNAELIPAGQVLNKVSATINAAILKVIKSGTAPEQAAQEAVNTIN